MQPTQVLYRHTENSIREVGFGSRPLVSGGKLDPTILQYVCSYDIVNIVDPN